MMDAVVYAIAEQVFRVLLVVAVVVALVAGGVGFYLGQRACKVEPQTEAGWPCGCEQRERPFGWGLR